MCSTVWDGLSSCFDGLATGLEGSVEDGGGPAVLRGEIAVARTHRESVLFPHRGPDIDSHPQIQIDDEPLHQCCLLIIFLAEQGEIGSYDPEEFRHHRGDTGEVMRSDFTLPPARERRHRHGRLKAPGIHGPGRRFKTHIHSFLATERPIAGNRAGICSEVFGRAELCRVDEDANDERVTA